MGVGSISYIYICLNILYLHHKTRKRMHGTELAMPQGSPCCLTKSDD